MSAAADKLRAWAKGLEAAKKAPQAAALLALAKTVEDEIATAGQSVAADASQSAERACLESIAAELSAIKTAGHREAPIVVEPETFAVLAAVKAFAAQLDYAVAGVRQMGEENSALKAKLSEVSAAAETLRRALHGDLVEPAAS